MMNEKEYAEGIRCRADGPASIILLNRPFAGMICSVAADKGTGLTIGRREFERNH